MGFGLYTNTGNNTYKRISNLRLGGAEGIVARTVDNLDSSGNGTWVLTEADLIATSAEDAAMVCFETKTEDGAYALMRVLAVQGQTSLMRTDMLLTLIPLDTVTEEGEITVTHQRNESKLHEAISLSGGWASNESTWKWQPAPLSLGGVSVGKKTS